MMLNGIEELGEGLFFVCAGSAMRQLRIQAELLAKAKVPVLIVGEEGSGKETAARLIHKLSGQSRNPILIIDCTKPCSRVLDRTLFGAAGAATAALSTGYQTVVLKNVLGLPPKTQTQILNRMAGMASPKNGGGDECRFRIIATCGESIEMSVGEGSFSAELYSYLSAFTIYIPPLRRRKDEVSLLLSHFMNQIACKYDLSPRLLSGAAHFACQSHSWPGNVKELEDFVKRYLIIGEGAIAFQPLRSLPLTVDLVTQNSGQERKPPN
ncbi:MAG TPA: sigma 54-interacting transcriptional regulator [Terriglobales bacterium]|jgi:DNA-binding NtrC family response regulator|nr:sigma 54-interacting transcriptional regulator [Terriglobales bacterium]